MGTIGRHVDGRAFIAAEDYLTLQRALSELSGSAEYAAWGAYFDAVNNARDTTQKLLSAKLFRETLDSLLSRKSTPVPMDVNRIQMGLNRYVERLSATVDILNGVGSPVPRVMHFVWVGGSEVGNNQRDYMNIWREVLKSRDYRFNLWYDSDALLSFEMNRVILESARASAMESGGDKLTNPGQLSKMIEDRARGLKWQMFDYINQPQWAGRADDARIDLMSRAYGKDRSALEVFRQRCLETHLAMVGPDLQLRDVRQEFAGHFLQDVYQREIAMRGNFAAASDIVRLQADHQEGGRYSDMDYLPPLADHLGGVDISRFNGDQRLAVLKLLLDHNEALMPGRDPSRYLEIRGEIPSSNIEALTRLALKKPGVHEIFVAPPEPSVPQDAIRLGTAHGSALAGEMNAHFIAHPGSAMIMAIMQMIRANYDCVLEVERRSIAAGIDVLDEGQLLPIIQDVVNEMQEHSKFPDSKIHYSSLKLIDAIRTYYQDGIRINARGTIALTGPGAAAAGLTRYIEQHLLPDQVTEVRHCLKLGEGYNVYTEEEMISGWTVNGDANEWLKKEQEKWRTGKLKSRYVGQLNELLKPQTLTFKQGWPVVEGRPVLLTSVLQQLIEKLGEPFIRVMKDKLSGEITFSQPFSIGFDVRQQILAQPVSDLPVSHGSESTSNLNELFTRVAHGSLALEQLSPLLHVMLGGIFGATLLDTAGVSNVWQEVLKVAGETMEGGLFARYSAIEKALREHSSAEFALGLARGSVSYTHTARELKVLALNDPLTMTQWGERIGQINRTAQREYHTQVVKRGAQIREAFLQAGAVTTKQMPQDLLIQASDDPGRRCYPLTLFMAAALPLGESAVRALIGRVAVASQAPEDADSRALLLALDELHEVPLSEVGKPLGSHGLDSVVQLLETKVAPAIILLDTGNHALLVAKIKVGDQHAYRFYEPNFAIFEFADASTLKQGVMRYLTAENGAIARLYGLSVGEGSHPQFNLVEVNTAAIAHKVLSTNLRLDSFLQNAPLADAQAATVWEKHAVERTRALHDSSRMGASLAHLDARYWAGELEQATAALRIEHKVGRGYFPLLETVQEQPDGSSRVTLVDASNPQIKLDVTTTDSRLGNVRNHLQRQVKVLVGNSGITGEADGGSRLSFAFAIQALITEMRHREYQAGGEQLPALTIALQVQVYLSYAQLSYGVFSDSLQIIRLVRLVAASEQALRQSSMAARHLSRAGSAIGFVFSVATIGMDIYGLATASNQEQRSRLATQLVFDVAALALDIVALAAGGTIGAAAAILSVPLLGIGIGVTAIASNLGQISDKAKGVGAHLRKIQDAYGPGVYTRKDGVLSFEPEAVITELDLQGNRIRFDSQRFYPMDRGGLELPQFNNHPKQLHRAINIREALGSPSVVSLIRTAPGDVQAVVLPCTPLCYYGYEYQIGTAGYAYLPQPGELQREPQLFSEKPASSFINSLSVFGSVVELIHRPTMETWYPSLRNSAVTKLEYDENGTQRFYFFVNTPFPHILYKLHPFNKPTEIVVKLDNRVRQLVVPALPKEWQGCISYKILTPAPGKRQLWLTPGLVAVSLHGDDAVQWGLHAPWVREDSFRFAEGFLSVGGIRIEGHVDFIELAHGELFKVDLPRKRLILASVTLENASAQAGASGPGVLQGSQPAITAVLSRIRALAAAQRVAAYVALHKFQLPLSPTAHPVFVAAWYDVAQARLLSARNLPESVNEGVVLATASAEHAWFYHPGHATVWRVDTVTGTVNHRYRLMNPVGGSRIVGCQQTAHGINVQQTMLEVDNGVEVTFEYLLNHWAVILVSINISAAREELIPKTSADYWHSLIKRFDTPRVYADATPGMAPSLSSWGATQFVQLRSNVLDTLHDLAWMRLADRMYFRLARPGGLETDTILLVWNDGLGDRPLFYSQKSRLLYRGGESQDAQDIATDVVEVSEYGALYIVTREDGRLFEIDKQGVLKFVGVGPRWFKENTDWLAALPALVKDYRDAPFSIIGLGNASGKYSIAAWCIDEQVVLMEVGSGANVTLLGLTPDRNAAWLLDSRGGQLYRQPTVGIESLRAAFGTGTKLTFSEQLPRAERVWPQWSFAQVQLNGQGLIGQTHDGINVELQDRQPARIVSMENGWSSIRGKTDKQLQAGLRWLLARHSHAPVLLVASLGGRQKYYLPETDHLFEVSGQHEGGRLVFLGTRQGTVPILFDTVEGRIFSIQSSETERTGINASHGHREGEVLSLELRDGVTDVVALLPDGVAKLILGFGSQTSGYRVSDEAWQRLDCIVIDRRLATNIPIPGTGLLSLDLTDCARLLISRTSGHLVFTDPDSGHTLIVRDIDSQEGELQMPMALAVTIDGKQHTFSIEQLQKAYSQTLRDEPTAMLGTVIKEMI
ncbi:TcdA/TcdB pore-forming domain-containing protein [Pseudomonas sp. UV AK001]|uniref:TcdA/TcdB pore-forming domain-containing protein n=1 Tax=Pseudomonas sp. UV AK001 TaxID=3384791 RepID=UPI0038D40167